MAMPPENALLPGDNSESLLRGAGIFSFLGIVFFVSGG